MNERIRELINEATCFKEGDTEGKHDIEVFDKEKFAELIVQECITIVDEQKECLHEEQKYWHDRDYGYEMAVNDASKGIKQFFGVEE